MKSDLERAREVDQDTRRVALIERLGTIADLCSQTPLSGDLGDVAYDLLRQAAAQISSDRLRLAFAKSECATRDAEIERLRGALEEIAALPGEINPNNYGHDDVCILNDGFVETYRVARAALSNKDAG